LPSYLTQASLWATLWPIPLAAAALGGALHLACRPKEDRNAHFLAVAAFALLGLVTGFLAGFSRQPAIGAVLPAVLSLVGGLSIYLIGARKVSTGFVGVCVIALSLDLLLGATWGAGAREAYEDAQKSAGHGKQEALVEAEIRDFRRALDLPDYPPTAPPKLGEPPVAGAQAVAHE
jgi:hypothetical protein